MEEKENGESSAATILVSIVVILIILLAFYFGFMRGGTPSDDVNVDVDLPAAGQVTQ
jgi:hypothetical protein